jgi:hypothetical protein
MRHLVLLVLLACQHPQPPAPWPVPDRWRSELIPFPLEFAPGLPHRGVEEIRFPPGFFDPAAAGYWSYVFVWRLDAAAAFDEGVIAGELTTYFRGLIAAVDEKHEIANVDSIAAHATRTGNRLALTAHVIDAFKTKLAVELVGTASAITCKTGAVWVFVLAPATSAVRGELDALAARAACDQPPVPNKPRS